MMVVPVPGPPDRLAVMDLRPVGAAVFGPPDLHRIAAGVDELFVHGPHRMQVLRCVGRLDPEGAAAIGRLEDGAFVADHPRDPGFVREAHRFETARGAGRQALPLAVADQPHARAAVADGEHEW